MIFEKQIKRMKLIDWAIAKLAIITSILFLIKIWPALRDLILSVNPWYYFFIAVISIIIIQIRVWRR